MKKITLFSQLLAVLLFFGSITLQAQTGTWPWQQMPAGTNNSGAASNATDSAGNVFLGGTFSGSITFGTQTFTNTSTEGKLFLAKYDASGNIIWAKTTSSNIYSTVHEVATDTQGNVYAIGHFRNTLTIDNVTLTSLSATFGYDIYIMKLSPEGNLIWAKTAGGPASSYIYPEDIAVDASNNVYITGTASGDQFVFGNVLYTVGGERDLFVAKYNSDGTTAWVKGAAAKMMAQHSSSVAIDNLGNVFVTGGYEQGGIDFEGQEFESTGVFNAFLAKYNSTGILQWANAYNASIVYGMGIATDDDGDVYVSGVYNAPGLELGNINLPASNNNDAFIAKFNTQGTTVWANKFTGGDFEWSAAKLVCKNNQIYMAGFFGSAILTYGDAFVVNTGEYSLFISSINTDGQLNWLDSTGPSLQYLSADGISVTNDGNLYINGYFSQGMTFGSNVYTANVNTPYLTRYNPGVLTTKTFSKSNLSLYPNPASNIINIAGSDMFIDAVYTITDLAGKTVQKGNLDTTINVSSLSQGMYIFSSEGKSTKFIKE